MTGLRPNPDGGWWWHDSETGIDHPIPESLHTQLVKLSRDVARGSTIAERAAQLANRHPNLTLKEATEAMLRTTDVWWQYEAAQTRAAIADTALARIRRRLARDISPDGSTMQADITAILDQLEAQR